VKPDLVDVHRKFPAIGEYLSGIFILRRDYGEAGNTKLSAWVGVSGSAVSQALTRLKRLQLVRQKRYGDIALTPAGRRLAIRVLRRHYLLEHLLVRILEYPWEKADEEAKQLQNLISEDLTEHLYRRLGSPQTCPHGNPMPGSPIEEKLLTAPKLRDAPDGRAVRILRITEEGEQVPSLLDSCHASGVWPGARFRVKKLDSTAVHLDEIPAGSAKPRKVALPLEMAGYVRYEDIPEVPHAAGK
jgi:DtxR family transcriptional regulator, Mn-dependent transcriptional regulator